jgi:SNF2 family DNA or RNA helicase
VATTAAALGVGGNGSRLTPRGYQRDGIAWLHGRGRAMLTDQYGLGKTAQAIWAAVTPAIVFCPGYLMTRWAREIKACKPDARVIVGDAARVVDRQAQLNSGVADFYVCNVELLRHGKSLKRQYLGPHVWFRGLQPLTGKMGEVDGYVRTAIFDESHRLRGHKSAMYAGAEHVCKRVERVYELTATPVYNQPDDLYGQLKLLDPERFTSYYRFLDLYCNVYHTPWGPKVIGMKRDRKLKEVFAEYAMGRTREDVDAQLPEMQETVIEIDGGKEFYDMYRATRRAYRDRYERQLLSQQSVLVALREMTQDVKLKTAVELVVDAGAKNVLIYTYHKSLAYALGKLLKWPVITGDTPAKNREDIARAHDNVVATFPSVAEGVDLSHMQYVIYMEHDWMPGLMGQSLARVQRPTNMHSHTFVYHLIVKKTADAVIHKVFTTRGRPMNEIIEAALAEWEGDDESDAELLQT